MNLREQEVIRPTVMYLAIQHTALTEAIPHDADEFD